MAKKKKEPSELGTPKDSKQPDLSGKTTSNSDFITGSKGLSSEKQPALDSKGRHFWYVVYPSENYIRTNFPDCEYDGADGWGTAPDNWIELLQGTGLAFNVSPLHCFDVNIDPDTGAEKLKKPHWHVIVSWGNTTTYRSARALCDMLRSPSPKLLRNVTGAYRYATHADNPEKYQYGEKPVSYNGWAPPLDTSEVLRIKQEIKEMVLVDDIQEYAELLIVCEERGIEYFDVACNNTFYCEKLCSSYRHNPERVLMRFYNSLQEGEKKDAIGIRIEQLGRSVRMSRDKRSDTP